MTKGRKPLPTSIKKLRGNPGKRPLPVDEPQPEGVAVCPDWIDDRAKEVWTRYAPELRRMGVLTFVDEPSMASLCQAVADFRAAVEEIRADGMTVSTAMGGLKAHPCITMRNDAARRIALFGALFGMDPSSRSRLSVVKPPEDPLANFLGGKKKPSGA